MSRSGESEHDEPDRHVYLGARAKSSSANRESHCTLKHKHREIALYLYIYTDTHIYTYKQIHICFSGELVPNGEKGF